MDTNMQPFIIGQIPDWNNGLVQVIEEFVVKFETPESSNPDEKMPQNIQIPAQYVLMTEPLDQKSVKVEGIQPVLTNGDECIGTFETMNSDSTIPTTKCAKCGNNLQNGFNLNEHVCGAPLSDECSQSNVSSTTGSASETEKRQRRNKQSRVRQKQKTEAEVQSKEAELLDDNTMLTTIYIKCEESFQNDLIVNQHTCDDVPLPEDCPKVNTSGTDRSALEETKRLRRNERDRLLRKRKNEAKLKEAELRLQNAKYNDDTTSITVCNKCEHSFQNDFILRHTCEKNALKAAKRRRRNERDRLLRKRKNEAKLRKPVLQSSTATRTEIEEARRLLKNECGRRYRKRKKEAKMKEIELQSKNDDTMSTTMCNKCGYIFQNELILNLHICDVPLFDECSYANTFEHEITPEMKIDIQESPLIKEEQCLMTEVEDKSIVKMEPEELTEVPVEVPNDSFIFEKKFGTENGAEILRTLKEKYTNKEHTNMKILDENNNFVISIVTPFMQRVGETMKQSSEIWFVDSMSSVVATNCKIVVLMTNSFYGGQPVALMITSLDTCEAITEGFKMMQGLFSPTSFGGRGKRGPVLFMIRRVCKTERAALLDVFPEARVLLCLSEVLSSIQNVINDCLFNRLDEEAPGHQVLLSYKRILQSMFKSIVYEKNPNVVPQIVENFLNHKLMISYPRIRSHFQELLNDLEGWIMCHRINLRTRGQTTNKIGVCGTFAVKSEMRHHKTESPVELMEILINDFQKRYTSKLIQFCNFGVPWQMHLKNIQMQKKSEKLIYSADKQTILLEVVSTVGPKVWVHESDTMKTYTVDVEEGLCSCPEGINDDLCKHLFEALEESNELILKPPRTIQEIRRCFYVATGSHSLHEHPQGHLKLEDCAPYNKVYMQKKPNPWTPRGNECEDPIFVPVEEINEEAIANGWIKFEKVDEKAMLDGHTFMLDESDDTLIDLKSKIHENPAL